MPSGVRLLVRVKPRGRPNGLNESQHFFLHGPYSTAVPSRLNGFMHADLFIKSDFPDFLLWTLADFLEITHRFIPYSRFQLIKLSESKRAGKQIYAKNKRGFSEVA